MKILFHLTIVSLMQLASGFTATGTLTPDKITGQYWSPKKDARIEIYKKGDKYFGKFTWAATPRKDTHNPNESLRSRDVVGMEFLTNFSPGQDDYSGGEIYDPESGKTYDCKMSLNGDNLKVRGYIGFSLLGRTETFERIQ